MTGVRFRVGDLSERTETSIETIRFYQKRGLLPPPAREGRIAWYEPHHVARLARIRELQDQGFPLALIGRVIDLDVTDAPLAAAVLEATAGSADDGVLTKRDLAAAAGVAEPVLDAIIESGILAPHSVDGEPRFSIEDIDLVRGGIRLLEFGIPVEDLLALAREHDAMTRAVSEQAIALFDTHVRQPLRRSHRPDEEKAIALVEAFEALLPTVSDLVARHFRRVLLEIATERLELDELAGEDT